VPPSITPIATPQPPMSWVQVEDDWEAELEEGRMYAILNQIRGVLKEEPSLADPAHLRQLGITLPPDFVTQPDVSLGRAAPAARDPRAVGARTGLAARHSQVRPEGAADPVGETQGGGGLLCANNRVAKLDPLVLSIWANVMRRLPAAGLRLDSQFQDGLQNVIAEAAARGLPTERIQAERPETYADYMGTLENCRGFLDTLSYSGHTVGLDALYMGLDIVTVAGGKMANRVGASLMTATGRGIFVEPSLKAYEDRAIELWSTHTRGQRQIPRDVPLFDASTWAREFRSVLDNIV
jgi:hypothetical protein